MDTSTDVTAKLIAWSKGDESAMNEVYPVVEYELKRLARSYLYTYQPGQPFQTTALINDAYIRLLEQKGIRWKSRAHFLAIAATMMRRILLNHLRDRKRKKRGDGALHITLSDAALVAELRLEELIDLDNALNRYNEIDPLNVRIVEMKFFGGMSDDEIAEVLGVSRSTAVRYFRRAKAWLARELGYEQ
ncbi:MAG: ECF-type sigma factor [Pyrinomonadaceae bacterium]